MKTPASIFNDVIGPVMRGPSSSHVAGAARIASLIRQSLGGSPRTVTVDFDINGSLAESHDGHGTDMGFAAGIIGMEMTDPAMPRAVSAAREAGVDLTFRVLDYGAEHPNNYRVSAAGSGGTTREWEAVSVGGGMIEMTRFDGFSVSINGGWHELLIKTSGGADAGAIAALFPGRAHEAYMSGDGGGLLSIKTETPPEAGALARARSMPGVAEVITLSPILPTPSRAGCRAPFSSARELLASVDPDRRDMWRVAAEYESAIGGESPEAVFEQMKGLLGIMRGAVRCGLAGTEYADRILGPQAHLLEEAERRAECGAIGAAMKCVTAIMETKSSMGVIVAAPTTGSCGCLPGTVIGAAEAMGLGEDDMTLALLAAGLIGVFIAEAATFAAEVAGCQVECGAGSGMAAAAVAQLLGGTIRQCADAASIALQNITGLVCDPVANRVEVPCLGKNIMGSANAITSANMALAGFDAVIPLDETIAAIYDIGEKLPPELRCTFGGLGRTPASLEIRRRLEKGAM